MEIALNSSVVVSSPSSRTTTAKAPTFNGFLPAPGASHRGLVQTVSSSGIYTAGGGFKNDSASNANSSLALLAALTLKGTLNGSTYRHNNRQQHVGFMSTNNAVVASNNPNVFSFTSAGIATAAATITSSSNSNILSLSSLAAASKNKISNKSTTKSSSSTTTTLSSSTTSSAAATSTTNSNLINSNNSNVKNLLTTTPTVTSTTAIVTTTTNNNNNVGGGKNNFQIPSDILDDLASRFIINVPDMELSNLIRICFQIELAHWFYLDFFCAIEEKKLQPCGMKQFAMQIFQHIPFLRKHLSSIDKILDDWKNYKLSVPTYGAILISEDLNYCLLVQSYFAKCSWGFPKGKVNENEDPVHCAAREVYEETGYDITELIVPNDYIEAVINYQYTRLYIVRNVSLQTQFSPRTRNEIKCCDWFPIDSLPINKNDAISKAKLGINANSFFMIMPFIKRLKKWVNDKRSGIETRRKYSGNAQQNATATPTSTSPVSAINNNVGDGRAATGGCNQKNANNSCKKNKQQYNDDNNALNDGAGGRTGGSGGSNSNANSNRSKRQRHKSMGDLDGIKLNNLSNTSTNSNCKTNNKNNNNNNNNNAGTKIAAADHHQSNTNGCNMMSNGGNGMMINGNGSQHKRNTAKNSAAGGAGNGNHNNSGSTKRQLFHSQSQCGPQNGEKIVSSFDLIRKEKQQMKAAAQAEKIAKAQKQQPQQLNGGVCGSNMRVRAKSQSDKVCLQQQQQPNTNNKNHNNNNNNNKQQQRLQKQQSMIVTNSNMLNNNNTNNINNNNLQRAAATTVVTGGHITPPPISGAGLLAIATAAAAAPIRQGNGNNNSFITSAIATSNTTSLNEAVSRPRPASVSYITPQASIINNTTTPIITTKSTTSPLLHEEQQQQQQQPQQLLQRMASGTNLRILKRAHSYQPQQLQQQQQQQQQQLQHHQQQHQTVKFTPSFNSWTNFSFTKNFIANVFC